MRSTRWDDLPLPIIIAIINLAVVLAVGVALLFVSIGNREAIDNGNQINEDTHHTALQVSCFASVYFIDRDPALDEEELRLATVKCIADGSKP